MGGRHWLVLLGVCALGCSSLKNENGAADDGGSDGGDSNGRGRDSGVKEMPGGSGGSRGMDAGGAGSGGSGGTGEPDLDAGTDSGAQDSGSDEDGGGDAMPAASRCATDNGGCDAHASCTDNATDPSATPTCTCLAGFTGSGTQCGAVLSALQLSAGTLEPPLSPELTAYTVAVPITTERLTFTPSAPAPATIVLNDDAIVASGSDWQSPLLELGFNSFGATIQHAGHADRDYTFNVIRGRQEAYLKGSGQAPQDCMGWDVDIDGDTVVVGAPGDIDMGAARGGSVYVFVRSGSSWSQQTRLQGDVPTAGDYFGASVAIDGDTLAVGASGEGAVSGAAVPQRGAVYVFTRSGGVWTQQQRVVASNGESSDFFGQDVSLAEDTLAVSAFYEDSVARGVLTVAPTDNDAAASGAAYVFTRAAGSWTERAYFKGSQSVANDEFGNSLAISRDPSGSLYTLVVGAAVDGVGVAAGATNYAGSVSIFRGSGASWTEEDFKTSSTPASYDAYGQSVDIDGNTIVVGAPREGNGAFYVYNRSSGAWQPNGPFGSPTSAEDDYYGGAVSISGSTIAVTASSEDSSGTGVTASVDELASNSGALYLYTFGNGFITRLQSFYVKAARVDADDGFGSSLAISGTGVVVGARGEASNAVTVDGDATNNGAAASGAAYVIR